ncbi:MAG: hypothetical protein IJA78_05305 [Clostridia bacterium]|nr:hypothetical protein [Clostridia bacterium]
MSEMLMELVGKRCLIRNEEMEYLTGSADVDCRVLAADDDWIKIAYLDRMGRRITRLERVETLDSVVIFEETEE